MFSPNPLIIIATLCFSAGFGVVLSRAVSSLNRRYEEPGQHIIFKIFSGQTLAIVLTTAMCSLLMLFFYGETERAAAGAAFCFLLIVLSFVDARTMFLPDILTLPLIALGLAQGGFGLFTALDDAAIGAAAGYAIPWTINTLFRIIRHKEGMGGGDFKLLAGIGAWTGAMQLPLILLLASLIALLAALVMRLRMHHQLPFGPSLALAGLACLLWGRQMMGWYLGLMGG